MFFNCKKYEEVVTQPIIGSYNFVRQYVVHVNKICWCVTRLVNVGANLVTAYTKCIYGFVVRILNMYGAKLRNLLSHRRWISSDGLLVVISDKCARNVRSQWPPREQGEEIVKGCDITSKPFHLLGNLCKLQVIQLQTCAPLTQQFVSIQSIDMCSDQLNVQFLSLYSYLNLFYRQSCQRSIVFYMKLKRQIDTQLCLLTHLVDIILTCAYHLQNAATWDASSITVIVVGKIRWQLLHVIIYFKK
jgi:hypothetical protein